MKVVAVVQARMGSTRLPGKVSMDIGGETCLSRVVRRLSRATRIGQIVIATTTSSADEVIVKIATNLAVECFRGSERDVLSRYVGAAEKFDAGAVVRVTSDCPLIDPELADQVVGEGVAGGIDFASNDGPPAYPRGLDVEFATASALREAARIALEPHHREHVTPIFRERADLFRTRVLGAEREYGRYRWTLDTPEDLELIRAIYAHFENRDDFTWRDVVALMENSPHLLAINAHIMQKPVHQVEALH